MHWDTINITSARKNLFQIIKSVNKTHIPVLITGKDGDTVLISSED